MKYVNLIFVTCWALTAVIGCCKADCIGKEASASFANFKAADTDSVLMVRYRPNTSFSSLVDSSWMYSKVSPTDTTRSSVILWFYGTEDTRVYLPSLNKTYLFTGFEFEKRRCCGERVEVVRSFLVNGVRKEGMNVVLE